MTETEQQLATLLARIVPLPADFDAQSDLIDGLAMESMQVMEFVMEAEDHFDVAIAQDKLADVRNIAQLDVIIEQL
ncbi:MAG: acyl carrier protein [Pseudomonadales bacterium]